MMAPGMDPFHRLAGAAVDDSPFPHVVADDLLDRELIDALVRELPSMDVLTGGRAPDSSERLHSRAVVLLAHPGIGVSWKSVVRAATDRWFLGHMATLFASHIHAAYPDFEQRIGPVLREYAEYFRANYSGQFQIVVVLNGCRDNTLQVVQAAASGFPEIKWL